MPEDRSMPNAALRTLFLAIEEVMGENGTKAVLNLSGMQHYIGNYPPNDLNQDVKFSQYGLAQQAIEDFYGPRGARAILQQIGRATFRYGLNEQPAILGVAGLALRLLPKQTRMKLILSRLAEAATKTVNQPTHLEEDDDAFIFVVDACPCAFRERKQTNPCCFTTVGAIQEGLKWATGDHFQVREISCINAGDDVCQYRVNKQPTE